MDIESWDGVDDRLNVSAAKDRLTSDWGEESTNGFEEVGHVVLTIGVASREIVTVSNRAISLSGVKNNSVEKSLEGTRYVTRSIFVSGSVMHYNEGLRQNVSTKVTREDSSSESAKVLKARTAGIRTIGECVEESEHERRNISSAESIEKLVSCVIIHKLRGIKRWGRTAMVVIDKGEGVAEKEAVRHKRGRSDKRALNFECRIQFHHVKDDEDERETQVRKDIDGFNKTVVLFKLGSDVHTMKYIITRSRNRSFGARLGGSGTIEFLRESAKFG